MAFGKLYTNDTNNGRGNSCIAVAKANKLDVEIVKTDPSTQSFPENYALLNHLNKIPTFQGQDGFVLTECIAIAVYFASQNEKTTLLGKTKQDYASILRWMSFANSEVIPAVGQWYQLLAGIQPYNKKHVTDAEAKANKAMKVLDDHFLVNTYFVADRLTLADVFAAFLCVRGFQNFFDKDWRNAHPNVSRWFETVSNQPIFTDVLPKVELSAKAMANVAPAKPAGEKKQAEKAAPKPKAAANDDEEEEAPAAPKPKHPLGELPRATFDLEELKREYSNKETREEALPWFWSNANFEEYSLYQVDYKYNDELTMTFMTSNLIGGFFARLEASRKYLFGATSVFGKTNDSVVRGAFIVRGQEALPAFDVAPDYESYSFTKLDPTKPETKEFVNDMWAWDKPVVVDGKTYEWADGKVFK